MKFTQLLTEKKNDMYGKRTPTIAFLGDSVTQGCFACFINEAGNVDTVFDRAESYVKKFERILATLYPSAQCNIINAGISGGSSADAVQRLERDVLCFHPDLVVVNLALNDCCCFGESGLTAYKENMRTLFTRIAQTGAEVILLTPNVMCDYKSACLNERLQVLAADFTARTEKGMLDAYVKTAKSVAKELKVPVCDCYAVWKNLHKNGVNTTELLSNRLNHPVPDMHWLFAFKLAEMIFAD